MLEAAFIFVAPDADPATHRSQIKTPEVNLTAIGVKNYAAAEEVAKELVGAGIIAIELCAGFGNEGVARIKKAVENKIPVGAVRFDNHPGLSFKSGDELFQ